MLAHLADVSIRSLLLALVAAFALSALRRRRTAALQHAVWTAVVCGMLALFALAEALPRMPLRVLTPPIIALPAAALDAPILEAAPAERIDPSIPAPPARSIDWSEVALYAYAAITFAFLARFLTGMFLVRRLLAKSAALGDFRESALIAVPLTVGWLRPKILLPLEWREWDREKLDAVLAHEGAHVRRRDGLVSALAGINRCIFWFHPLAWLLERRLALLAELACDESSVATLGDRESYARLLLDMARVVDGAHGRLQSHALTMAAPSHIRQRIDSILREGRTFSRGVTWTGWAAIALCGIPVVLGAGAVTLDRQPTLLQLAMPRLYVPAPPLLLAQAQPAPAPRPNVSTTENPAAASIAVSVLTADGKFVTGLERDNFQITEGDTESASRGFPITREIVDSFFTAEGRLAVGLVVSSTEEMTSAISIFRNALHPDDEFFVVEGGAKTLVERISGAIATAKQARNPVKVLVVITQGARRNPLGPERDITALARQAGNIPIYFADIEDVSASTEPGPTTYSQVEDLRAISRLTGGDFMSVANSLGDTLTHLAIRLRNQYVLGYVPSRAQPAGSLRRFSVEVVRVHGLPQLRVLGTPGFVITP